MTAEKTTTPKKTPPSTRWYARFARWFASTWIGRKTAEWWRRSGNTKPIKWRHLFSGVAMLAALGLLVVALIQSVANENVAQDRRAQDEKIYNGQVQDYRDAISTRALCLNGVENSHKNRDMWERTVKLLDDAGLADAAAYLSQGELLLSPARTTAECPPEPTAPSIPASLTGH